MSVAFKDTEKADGDLSSSMPTAPVDSLVTLSKTSRRHDGPPMTATWGAFLTLTFSAIGIIYGDLSTSPLYVFNAIYPSDGPVPVEEDVIGALSCIIWAITLIPLIKYCAIALEFGNGSGEGGPFAVFISLYPPKEQVEDYNRTLTTYPTKGTVSEEKSLFWQRKWVKNTLFVWVLLGVALTISDGILTPAVSVVSAVQGIEVPFPNVASSIVPISIAILVILFIGQTAGTARVGLAFAPVVTIWLLLIAVEGIVNLSRYPSVFRAFSPSYAVLWFVNGYASYDSLAGVLLAITGVEAFFANLGAFNKNSIRASFIFAVYPALMLAYLGQGAALITDGANVLPNVFFSSIPGGNGTALWWITWTFAILSAVIASQAMISATFALVQQLVSLNAMPPFKIVNTSNTVRGQIWCPSISVLLAIGTIAVVGGFGTNAALTNAYGLAVSGTLLVTTVIITVAIIRIKRLPIYVALAFLVGAGFIDGLFFGAALKKVPLGAWFPLSLAAILVTFLVFYSWARGLEETFDATHRSRLSDLFVRAEDVEDRKVLHNSDEGTPVEIGELNFKLGESTSVLKRRAGAPSPSPSLPAYDGPLRLVGKGEASTRIPIFAVFHNSNGNTLDGAPHSFAAFVKCWPSLPTVIVFLSILITGDAHVVEEDRYIVSRTSSFDGIYICKLRLGYRDPIDLSNVAAPLRARIAAIEGLDVEEGEAGEEARKRMEIVDRAIQNSVTHILPHFHPYAEASHSGNKYLHLVRKFLIESLYRRIRANFDEYDQYILNDEEILRMSISARL